MAGSLLAALVYGVPAREREGQQIPLPTTVKELKDILTPKGWIFTHYADEFINSATSVNWKGDTFLQHNGGDGKNHWDRLELLSSIESREDLIVACPERTPSLLKGLVVATKQRQKS